jgi:hypothetical protein
MSLSSDIEFGGWSTKVKAEMALSSGVKVSSTSVVFLTTRKIDFGYQGWERPPAFT